MGLCLVFMLLERLAAAQSMVLTDWELIAFLTWLSLDVLVPKLLLKTQSQEAVGELSPNAGEASVANIDKMRFADGDINTSAIRLKMQKTMQTHAAVFRTGDVMREGIDKMNALWKEMANLK